VVHDDRTARGVEFKSYPPVADPQTRFCSTADPTQLGAMRISRDAFERFRDPSANR
jgi:hypothetical protein